MKDKAQQPKPSEEMTREEALRLLFDTIESAPKEVLEKVIVKKVLPMLEEKRRRAANEQHNA